MARKDTVYIEDSEHKRYGFHFGFNAICDIQKETKLSVDDFWKKLKALGEEQDMPFLRMVLRHCVVEPDAGLSERQLGDLIDDVGLDKVLAVLGGEGSANPTETSSPAM